MIRKQLLEKAIEITVGKRDQDYGSPGANFLMASRMISAYLGWEVKPYEVAIILMTLKICRIKASPQKADNWLDIAGYSACGAQVVRVKMEDADKDGEVSDAKQGQQV